MDRPGGQLPTLNFVPITPERLKPQVWGAAVVSGVAFLAMGGLLLRSKNVPFATEAPTLYSGSALLTSHQIVLRVTDTITAHIGNSSLSRQIIDTLLKQDHAGDFDRLETSKDLSKVLTTRIQDIVHDGRFEVLYATAPPDIAQAHGRSIYRISEHLSVALPSSPMQGLR